jgi:hypothetical protein
MRTITQTINLFSIQELKDKFPKSFEKAHKEFAEFEVDDNTWYNDVIDPFIGKLSNLGFFIEVKNWRLDYNSFVISGFWKRVNFVQDNDNQYIAQVCNELRAFIGKVDSIKSIVITRNSSNCEYFEAIDDFDKIIQTIDLYGLHILNEAYDYALSIEHFLAQCEVNDYEFDASGKMFVQ